ncbi:hypothetical protein [Selenomonas sp.]|nr:hypothetical protein [Selenomonas sp.]
MSASRLSVGVPAFASRRFFSFSRLQSPAKFFAMTSIAWSVSTS